MQGQGQGPRRVQPRHASPNESGTVDPLDGVPLLVPAIDERRVVPARWSGRRAGDVRDWRDRPGRVCSRRRLRALPVVQSAAEDAGGDGYSAWITATPSRSWPAL